MSSSAWRPVGEELCARPLSSEGLGDLCVLGEALVHEGSWSHLHPHMKPTSKNTPVFGSVGAKCPAKGTQWS